MSDFSRIGLLGRAGISQVVDSLACLVACLERQGRQVFPGDTTSRLLQNGRPGISRQKMGEICDLVVVVGGDGHILGAARDFAPFNVPVLGVNRGRLGFLADISPDEIEEKVLAVLAGDYTLEEHFLLRGEVLREGRVQASATALNEVVIHPGRLPRMIEFDLKIEGEFVYNQHSDGLIISTPTGSTAYSLSAGGPIMHPSLDAIVLVPMFPHTLNSRPLVVKGSSLIEVFPVKPASDQVQVSFDSQTSLAAGPGDQVRIQKTEQPLSLVHPPGHSFFGVCRSKLDWASRRSG